MFLGNCDRIDPTTGRVQNSGNIMFQRMGDNESMMIGLDYYENSGEVVEPAWTNRPRLGRRISAKPEHAASVREHGRERLERHVHQEFGLEIEDFTQGHAWQIAIGMQEGIDSLHQFLSRRLSSKALPKPILARAMKLGWYN